MFKTHTCHMIAAAVTESAMSSSFMAVTGALKGRECTKHLQPGHKCQAVAGAQRLSPVQHTHT